MVSVKVIDQSKNELKTPINPLSWRVGEKMAQYSIQYKITEIIHDMDNDILIIKVVREGVYR